MAFGEEEAIVIMVLGDSFHVYIYCGTVGYNIDSRLCHRTIHPQNLPRHPVTILSTKKINRIRNLIWLANATKRTIFSDGLEDLIRLALEKESRGRWTGGDAVH